MIWSLVLLTTAILWLLARALRLFQRPLDNLVKALAIDIPRVPVLSIDNVTAEAVVLHWDRAGPHHYGVHVNGFEVTTTHASSVTLCGLSPATIYQVDVFAINSLSYRSKSTPKFFKTLPENLLGDLLRGLATGGKCSIRAEVLKKPRGSGRSRANTWEPPKAAATDNGGASLTDLSEMAIKGLVDIEELRYLLEKGQEELRTVLSQNQQALEDFEEQSGNLKNDRDTLRERKKIEDENRAAVRLEVKWLDETRQQLAIKREKATAKLQLRAARVAQMRRDVAEWHAEVVALHQRKAEAAGPSPAGVAAQRAQRAARLERLREAARTKQAALAQADAVFRQRLAEKRQKEALRAALVPVFEALGKETDKAGILSGTGARALAALAGTLPAWYADIQHEISVDARLEAEWRAVQQREVAHYAEVAQRATQMDQRRAQLQQHVDRGYSHEYPNEYLNEYAGNFGHLDGPLNGYSGHSNGYLEGRMYAPERPYALERLFASDGHLEVPEAHPEEAEALSEGRPFPFAPLGSMYSTPMQSTGYLSSPLYNIWSAPDGNGRDANTSGFSYSPRVEPATGDSGLDLDLAMSALDMEMFLPASLIASGDLDEPVGAPGTPPAAGGGFPLMLSRPTSPAATGAYPLMPSLSTDTAFYSLTSGAPPRPATGEPERTPSDPVHSSPFNARRLSNALGFGKKEKESAKHSKFFFFDRKKEEGPRKRGASVGSVASVPSFNVDVWGDSRGFLELHKRNASGFSANDDMFLDGLSLNLPNLVLNRPRHMDPLQASGEQPVNDNNPSVIVNSPSVDDTNLSVDDNNPPVIFTNPSMVDYNPLVIDYNPSVNNYNQSVRAGNFPVDGKNPSALVEGGLDADAGLGAADASRCDSTGNEQSSEDFSKVRSNDEELRSTWGRRKSFLSFPSKDKSAAAHSDTSSHFISDEVIVEDEATDFANALHTRKSGLFSLKKRKSLTVSQASSASHPVSAPASPAAPPPSSDSGRSIVKRLNPFGKNDRQEPETK